MCHPAIRRMCVTQHMDHWCPHTSARGPGDNREDAVNALCEIRSGLAAQALHQALLDRDPVNRAAAADVVKELQTTRQAKN